MNIHNYLYALYIFFMHNVIWKQENSVSCKNVNTYFIITV